VTEVLTLQVAEELAAALELFNEERPAVILEIGVHEGGTLKVWIENCLPGSFIVAVDPDHPNMVSYEEWERPHDCSLSLVFGRSQDPAVMERIAELGPYDWVFVDGDHGHSAVASDVALCLPLIIEGGHLLLHDIVDENGSGYPPGAVLDQLEASGYNVRRIVAEDVDPAVYQGAHGIGVVAL
jgi:cephalosporin hydroxylase